LGRLKEALRGRKFNGDGKVKEAVQECLKIQNKTFYSDQMKFLDR